MNKLEQAARQALEALQNAIVVTTDGNVGFIKQAIAALREALASRCQTTATEQDDGSVCARCGGIVYDPVIEQTEQSQLADASLEPVAYAPIITFRDAQHYSVSKQKTPEYCNPLYAAPLAQQDTHATHVVRTKDPCNPLQDLTDDEILKIVYKDYGHPMSSVDISRAVIAADRAKNNLCERTK